jgi:hypothetical protein
MNLQITNNKYLIKMIQKDLNGVSACLIVDSDKITKWQFESLKLSLQKGLFINCVFVCENTIVPRKYIKNGFYYLLNIFAMKNSWTKKVSWMELINQEIPVHYFKSDWDGQWQRINIDTLNKMSDCKFNFAIKFGMYLLRDPDSIPASHGVFSYHHGDPSMFRGRPAGFYELLYGSNHIGVMVQRLSNKLDAGAVMAFCTCKIFLHSYQQTLENAYRNGTFLLTKALKNALNGESLPHPTNGPNYRLPNNMTVLKFVTLLGIRKIRRLLYGAFVEKRWNIAYSPNIDIRSFSGLTYLPINKVFAIPKSYSFIADPIIFDEKVLLCEGMDQLSGKGNILTVGPNGTLRMDTSLLGNGHFSYPFIVRDGDNIFLLPEMSELGPQLLATLSNELKIEQATLLKGLENERLKDPTLIKYVGKWWLFAGKQFAAADILFLWSSENIFGPYEEHSDSPIVMDPSCARSAGPIINFNGQLFRLGQDNRGSYGNGITICKISQLSSERYLEEPVAKIRLNNLFGPHTLGFNLDSIVIDFYQEKLNMLAWLSRLKNKIRTRK